MVLPVPITTKQAGGGNRDTRGPSLDIDEMRDWLTRIEPYVLQGKVAWKTLPEMVDAHLDWEAAQQ